MGFWKKITPFPLPDWEDKVNCMIWGNDKGKNKKMWNDKSRSRYRALIFLCVLLSIAILMLHYTATEVQAKTVIKEITIGKGKSYAVGQDIDISGKAVYKTSNRKVTWKSSNKKVATVKNGKITAKKKGKAHMIHVSASADSDNANGTKEHPFGSIQEAVNHASGGSEIIIEEGTYEPFAVSEDISGTEKDITIIKAADGAHPVIQVPKKKRLGNSIGIYMENVSYLCLDGLEISGGTHGIYYESNGDVRSTMLSGITIRNCLICDIDGVHGIAVYATNDKIPVTGLVLKECEVYNCKCGDSESVVVNGNIDGFTICKNIIHDNNNIGIDMIGFEGTALHGASYDGNRYDVDFVRNGKCYGNKVYNISAEGNAAYLENGEYSLCAAGIYVDGGQNIQIYENEILNCDIGIEVATEHNPKENPLFQVAGIEVYDNEITRCSGFAGLSFGGYDSKRGFTVDCHFYRNTLTDNPVQIVVQRSRDNEIDHNTIIGGKVFVEYNEELPKEEMKNNFHDNVRKKVK